MKEATFASIFLEVPVHVNVVISYPASTRSAVKRNLPGDSNKDQRSDIYSMILEDDKAVLEAKLLRHEKKYGGKNGYFISNYGWKGQWPPNTWFV